MAMVLRLQPAARAQFLDARSGHRAPLARAHGYFIERIDIKHRATFLA